jgi:DNA-binding IscR family transcriptional regulator
LCCANHRSENGCDDCEEENCSVRLVMYRVKNAISYVLDDCMLTEITGLHAVDRGELVYHI